MPPPSLSFFGRAVFGSGWGRSDESSVVVPIVAQCHFTSFLSRFSVACTAWLDTLLEVVDHLPLCLIRSRVSESALSIFGLGRKSSSSCYDDAAPIVSALRRVNERKLETTHMARSLPFRTFPAVHAFVIPSWPVLRNGNVKIFPSTLIHVAFPFSLFCHISLRVLRHDTKNCRRDSIPFFPNVYPFVNFFVRHFFMRWPPAALLLLVPAMYSSAIFESII